MSSATAPVTLADLRTAFYTRVRDASSTANDTIVDHFLNVALRDMHIAPIVMPWWALRRASLITHAPYTTGTVAISASARTTVTGTDTLWNTAVTGFGVNNAQAGGKMKFSGLNEIYTVSAVGSDTSITLESRYTGDALTAGTYTYFEDEYSLAADFLGPADARLFSSDRNIPFIGPMEFRRLVPRNDVAGRPRVATMIQLGFSGSTTPRPRVVLSPYPDTTYTIPYNYVTSYLAVTTGGTEQTSLTNTTDEPIVPFAYRMAIVYHALYHYYRDRKDDVRSQEAKAEYTELMNRIANDSRIGQTDHPQFVTVRGKSYRRGRFDVGNRFDKLDW